MMIYQLSLQRKVVNRTPRDLQKKRVSFKLRLKLKLKVKLQLKLKLKLKLFLKLSGK